MLIKILVTLFIINRIIVLVDASQGTYDFISTTNGRKKEVDDEEKAFIVFQILENDGPVISPISKPSDLEINTFDIFTSSLITTRTETSSRAWQSC